MSPCSVDSERCACVVAGPLDISWAVQSPAVSAILECYFPAQSTGQAVYQALTSTGGDSVPAARLPVTWPVKVTDVQALLILCSVV